MIVHILGFGSIGIITAYILRTKSPFLPIRYLSRAPFPSTTFKIHVNDESFAISDIQDDNHNTCPIEILFVTTKCHDTESAVSLYLNRITPKTLLVFIQNGMGVQDTLPVRTNRVILGTTTHAAYRSQRNEVHWVYAGESYFSGTYLSDDEQRIVSALGSIVPYPFLEATLYRKLAYNASINPVTAIYCIKNGVIADPNSEAHSVSQRLAQEIRAVFAVAKPDLDFSNLEEEVMQLARNTGKNISSMCADVQAGRETEIDFINGYIIKLGRAVGVNTPVNEDVIIRVKGIK